MTEDSATELLPEISVRGEAGPQIGNLESPKKTEREGTHAQVAKPVTSEAVGSKFVKQTLTAQSVASTPLAQENNAVAESCEAVEAFGHNPIQPSAIGEISDKNKIREKVPVTTLKTARRLSISSFPRTQKKRESGQKELSSLLNSSKEMDIETLPSQRKRNEVFYGREGDATSASKQGCPFNEEEVDIDRYKTYGTYIRKCRELKCKLAFAAKKPNEGVEDEKTKKEENVKSDEQSECSADKILVENIDEKVIEIVVKKEVAVSPDVSEKKLTRSVEQKLIKESITVRSLNCTITGADIKFACVCKHTSACAKAFKTHLEGHCFMFWTGSCQFCWEKYGKVDSGSNFPLADEFLHLMTHLNETKAGKINK